MQYAKVENGEVTTVGLPTFGKIGECSVSNYDKLPEAILLHEGWLPVSETVPTYDADIEQLQLTGYIVQQNQVIPQYNIIPKTADPPSVEERLESVEIALMEFLI